MSQRTWHHGGQKAIVCVDSYHNSTLQGRLYHTSAEPEIFESLTQFLVKMEQFLDTSPPPKSDPSQQAASAQELSVIPFVKGAKATFQVQVFFRHNTSWQGVIVWLEEQVQQHFRSALSLILLLDRVLLGTREGDAV